jgi:hypothetical protein
MSSVQGRRSGGACLVPRLAGAPRKRVFTNESTRAAG